MGKSQRETAEVVMANDLSQYLCFLYPNHAWAVNVDTDGGIIRVIEADLMDTTVPYVINLNDCMHSAKKMQKMIMIAGGEILERLKLSRDRRKLSAVIDSKEALQTNLKGNAILDTHGCKNWVGGK